MEIRSIADLLLSRISLILFFLAMILSSLRILILLAASSWEIMVSLSFEIVSSDTSGIKTALCCWDCLPSSAVKLLSSKVLVEVALKNKLIASSVSNVIRKPLFLKVIFVAQEIGEIALTTLYTSANRFLLEMVPGSVVRWSTRKIWNNNREAIFGMLNDGKKTDLISDRLYH